MVHALHQIHNLLKPTGYLIDIRPNGDLFEFIRLSGKGEQFIGYLYETDDYIEYHQAESAVQQVLAQGLFQYEKVGQFEFRTHADCFADLKSHLEDTWSDSLITEQVIAEANRQDDEFGIGTVFLHGRVHIGLLIPLF